MVDMDEVDGGVELQYSSLHSISNMKILTEPQLHASRFYFLLCHWLTWVAGNRHAL